jgi:hypothetical protein
MTARSTAKRHRSADHSLCKGMIDGRTVVARRRGELIEIYAEALGGVTALSEGQYIDIRKAAELTALAEQARARAMRERVASAGEISAMVRLEGMAARAVKALNVGPGAGIPKPKSLAEHIANRATKSASKRARGLA